MGVVSQGAADDRATAGIDGGAFAREIGAGPELEPIIGDLLELGVPAEAIRRAHERGRVDEAIFEAVLDPIRNRRTVSATQIEADGGLEVDEIRLIMLTFGLRAPDPDEPYFTPEEAEVMRRFGELREIWPPEVYLQVTRVYGQALAHIAQTEIHAFRLHVEPRLRAEAGSAMPALAAVHSAFGRLLPLADPMLLGVHRRRVEHELAQEAVREAEARTPEGRLPGAVEVTLAFVDLSDFTAYADAHGDLLAVEVVESFAQAVTAELGENGRVLKALGDGYMLSFPDPHAAVSACVRIIDQIGGDDTPGVHASVHHGVALYREGDYFGSAVNLAARLLALARDGELVASMDVVRATGERFAWHPPRSRHLRGFSEPVEFAWLWVGDG